jgi:uncharacterized membrane protein
MTVGALLLALHLLGAIVWVGGMFFALAVLRPGMSFLDGPVRLALHQQVLRRFFRVVWHVIPVLLVTGFAMIFLFYGGFGRVPWNIHVMTGSGIAMSLIFAAIVAGPWASLNSALADGDLAGAGDALHRIRVLVIANLAIGVLTAIAAVLET